jgi:hypothetical protein
MELFLCNHGFGKIYESHMAEQKKKTILTATPGDPAYWQQVLACLPKKGCKEQMAIEAMMRMRRMGLSAVPLELQNVLNRTVALARS